MKMKKMPLSRAELDQISVTTATDPLNVAFAAFWALPNGANCCQPESGGPQVSGVRYWAKRDRFLVNRFVVPCPHVTA